MKVAKKSPKRLRTRRPPTRNTLTLSADAYQLVDELRGEESRSAYVQRLVERERARQEHEEFIARVNAEYTPEVCAQTLRVHAEFPMHGAL